MPIVHPESYSLWQPFRVSAPAFVHQSPNRRAGAAVAKAGWVQSTPIVDSKSGVSGAGRSKTDSFYTFSELTGPAGYVLSVDGRTVDQSVHGKDFWQTDYKPASKRWSRTQPGKTGFDST